MDLHEKLTRVLNSATALFIVPGFAETKMSAIAADAGLAVGTLYQLFKSKDDLLQFVFATTLEPDLVTQAQSLPVQPVSTDTLVQQTTAIYQQANANLQGIVTKQPTDARFEALLDYLFTNFHQYGAYFLMLERNPQMNPALLQLYKRYRQQLYQNVAELLTTLITTGEIRYLSHPEDDAMIIIDQVFWWSAHKHYDSFERQANHYDRNQMAMSVRKQLLTSYL